MKKPKNKKFDVDAYKKKLGQKTYYEKIIENVYKDKLPPWMKTEDGSMVFPTNRSLVSMNSSMFMEGGDDDSLDNSNGNLIRSKKKQV